MARVTSAPRTRPGVEWRRKRPAERQTDMAALLPSPGWRGHLHCPTSPAPRGMALLRVKERGGKEADGGRERNRWRNATTPSSVVEDAEERKSRIIARVSGEAG